MSATPDLDLCAYWTTGPGSVPLGPPMTEPTLREGIYALLYDTWIFLRLPLLAAVLSAPASVLITWAAMHLRLL